MTRLQSMGAVFSVAAALAVLAPVQPARAEQGYAGSFGTDHGSCDRGSLAHAFSGSQNNLIGSALGAAAGGLLASQFGHGSGKGVLTLAGVLGGALAGGSIGRSMEPADQACINKSLENAPTGQAVTWHNPDNNANYRVTPTRSYTEGGGAPCRDYVTEATIDGKQEKTSGHACRQSDGTWKSLDDR